jgi:hypothetical protein
LKIELSAITLEAAIGLSTHALTDSSMTDYIMDGGDEDDCPV